MIDENFIVRDGNEIRGGVVLFLIFNLIMNSTRNAFLNVNK